MFNMFMRRNRNYVFLSLIAVVGIYIIYTSILLNNQEYDSQTKQYCNAPHKVEGKEREQISGYQLKQVQILIRHGDRAPIDPKVLPNTEPVKISCRFNLSNALYRYDLYRFATVIKKNSFLVKNSDNKILLEERDVCEGGQLTPTGILQHIYLGSHLRTSYIEFLKKLDPSKDVHILVTDVPRTKQSVAALISGMFSKEVLESKVNSPFSINVHKDHIDDAHLLLDEKENDLPCTMITKKSKEFWSSKKYQSFQEDVRPLYRELAIALSSQGNDLPKFNRIVDIFYTRICHELGIPLGPNGKAIPGHVVKEFLDMSSRYHYIKHSAPLAELQALSLFSLIAKHALLSIRNEKEQKKVILYSGHDSMIHPFLQVIDQKFQDWPPYASRIVIEIYLTDGTKNDDPDIISKTYYRIIYNGVPLKTIKFCYSAEEPHMLCPLAELYRYVTNGFVNFSKYDTNILVELLFARIKALCLEEIE